MSERTCKQCGCVGHFHETVLTTGPHYGKVVCKECGKFYGWLPKPHNETRRRRNRHTAETLGITSCQMCQRTKSRLGLRGVLEPHHVVEIQYGGEDKPDNIWIVCTACHKLIHYQRTYINEHLKSHITTEELNRLMLQDNVPESVRPKIMRILEEVQRNGQG